MAATRISAKWWAAIRVPCRLSQQRKSNSGIIKCARSLTTGSSKPKGAVSAWRGCIGSFRGRGLGTAATHLVLAYAFDVLALHRVELRVLTFNERAIACYEKCGFVREGVEREGAWIGGEWQSDLRMSILEHEFKEKSAP